MAPLLMELKMQMRVDGGVSFAYKRGGNEGTMDADEFRHAVSESIINLSNSSPEIPPRFLQDSPKNLVGEDEVGGGNGVRSINWQRSRVDGNRFGILQDRLAVLKRSLLSGRALHLENKRQ